MANSKKTDAEIYREQRKERLAKAAKKNSKKSRKIHLSKPAKTVIAVVIVLAIVAGIGAYAYSNSDYKARSVIAMTVNGEEVPAPEYAFYYNSVLLQTFNYAYYYDSNYGQGYGQMLTGYDYTQEPGAQSYTAAELEGYENPTWLDYFDHTAKETIKRSRVFAALAVKEGLALDEEDAATVQENLDSLKESAESSNVALGIYLNNMYGKGVSKGFVKALLEREALASKYQEYITDGYKDGYSAEELEEYYAENKTNYDVVSIRYYNMNAEKVETPSVDETTGEETTVSKVTDATMAAAKQKADAMAAAVKDDEGFKKSANDFAKAANAETAESYLTDDSATLYDAQTNEELTNAGLNSEALTWAFDSARAVGDTFVAEVSDTGYVVYMISVPAARNMDNDYTYSVRHILVNFPDETETTTAEPTTAEPTTAEPATVEDPTDAAAATTVAEGTTAADATTAEAAATTASEEDTATTEATTEPTTEAKVTTIDTSAYGDAVIDLNVDAETAKNAKTYGEAQDILVKYLKGNRTADAFGALAKEYTDDSNGEDGGLYEDVPLGQMVPEFEDWCLEDGRKNGDVGIVETSYGYHIMYFEALNDNGVTWEYNVKSDKSAEEFTAYSEEELAKEEYAIEILDEKALTKVGDFATSNTKAWIKNIANQASSLS